MNRLRKRQVLNKATLGQTPKETEEEASVSEAKSKKLIGKTDQSNSSDPTQTSGVPRNFCSAGLNKFS